MGGPEHLSSTSRLPSDIAKLMDFFYRQSIKDDCFVVQLHPALAAAAMFLKLQIPDKVHSSRLPTIITGRTPSRCIWGFNVRSFVTNTNKKKMISILDCFTVFEKLYYATAGEISKEWISNLVNIQIWEWYRETFLSYWLRSGKRVLAPTVVFSWNQHYLIENLRLRTGLLRNHWESNLKRGLKRRLDNGWRISRKLIGAK